MPEQRIRDLVKIRTEVYHTSAEAIEIGETEILKENMRRLFSEFVARCRHEALRCKRNNIKTQREWDSVEFIKTSWNRALAFESKNLTYEAMMRG